MKNNLSDNEQALWILKTNGPQCLHALAIEMNISVEGARFHLLKLAGEGLVEATSLAKGRGRPQQIWSLTNAGHERFPDKHADLSVKLIKLIKEQLGEEALDEILKVNEQNGISKYGDEMKACSNLEDKVNKLAEIRDKEGYMAEYVKEDDGFLLVENHCPICAAAKACGKFCTSELNTFQAVLGENVKIERTEHILSGSRRCAYKISKLTNKN